MITTDKLQAVVAAMADKKTAKQKKEILKEAGFQEIGEITAIEEAKTVWKKIASKAIGVITLTPSGVANWIKDFATFHVWSLTTDVRGVKIFYLPVQIVGRTLRPGTDDLLSSGGGINQKEAKLLGFCSPIGEMAPKAVIDEANRYYLIHTGVNNSIPSGIVRSFASWSDCEKVITTMEQKNCTDIRVFGMYVGKKEEENKDKKNVQLQA